jgi:hypothetical protein
MKMMDTKLTKNYYLSLSYKEKIKTLRRALDFNLNVFFVIADYYLKASEEEGGLSKKIIDREMKIGLRRKYYTKTDTNE